MSRWAVLAGGGSFDEFVSALGILMFFGFAFSWISANVGMTIRDLETAQVAGFLWVFPFVFASSIFVPGLRQCRIYCKGLQKTARSLLPFLLFGVLSMEFLLKTA